MGMESFSWGKAKAALFGVNETRFLFSFWGTYISSVVRKEIDYRVNVSEGCVAIGPAMVRGTRVQSASYAC